MKLNLLIVVLILTVNNISAQTWDGGGGDNNWSTAANWSGDAVPTGSAAVTFNGTSTKDVTIDNVSSWSGGSFTISSGYTGTITQSTAVTTGAFSQADGTFTGGASTLDINSSYAISGGTFTAPSGSMTVASSFTQTGSPTWNHNSGTVTFDGSGSASISAPDISFNKVVITKGQYNANTEFTIAAGTTIPLGDSPTTSIAWYDLRQNALVNNGTITVGTGTWTVSIQSFTNNGTITTNASTLNFSWTSSWYGWVHSLTNNGTWTNNSATTLDFAGSYSQGDAGASITCANDANVYFGGSLTVTAGGSNFMSGHSTITFDGNLINTTSIDAAGVTFSKVIINKGARNANTTFTIAAGTTIPLGDSPSTTIGWWDLKTNALINNGTITVGTGTWTVSIQSFTNNGTITTNASTLNFSWTSSWYGWVHSLTNNSTWTNNSATTLDFAGSYTQSDAGASITCANDANVYFGGSLTVTAGGSNFLSGHSTITFDGNLTNTTSIDAAGVTFSKVIINKGARNANTTFTIAAGTTIPLGDSPSTTIGWWDLRTNALINNGTITVGTGTWTVSVQSFTNSGTITSNVTTINWNWTSSWYRWVHSLTNNGTWTNNSATTLNFEGNYAQTDENASFTCANGANISIGGSLTVTGGASNFLSGHSTITFDGTIATSSTVNASDATFQSVIISKNTSASGITPTFTVSSGTSLPLGDSPTITANNSHTGSYNFTNSGTLVIGTGIFTESVEGTFTNNGTIRTKTTSKSFSGTYTENGTIEFTGDGDASADTYTVTDFLSTYNNLTINSTDGSTDTYQLGSAASLAGDFTLTTGTFADEGYTLSVNGDAVNNGTHTGSGKISLTGGSSSHSVSGTGSFTNLELNDANGASLASGQTVNGTLTVTTGDFDLNGNTLTLGTSGTISESAGNTLTGTSGTVSTTRSLNAPSSENVGGMGVILTSTSDLGSTVITRGHSTQTIGGNESIYRYFELVPTNNSGLDATVVFTFDESELNSISESNLMMCKSTSPYTNWTDLGGSVDEGGNTVTVSGVDSFSRFTLGDESQPMPVELVSFTAEVKRDKVILKWKTATEVNNYGFYIERRKEKGERRKNDDSGTGEWSRLGFVEGAGNSNSEKSYSYIEKMKETGVYYYRLKQIDMDGSYDYSDEVEITFTKMPQESKILQNYPNPFNPRTVMSYELSVMSEVRIVVYDILGNELSVLVDGVKEAGIHEVEFDGTNLSSGMYFYTLTTGSVSITRKMLLLK